MHDCWGLRGYYLVNTKVSAGGVAPAVAGIGVAPDWVSSSSSSLQQTALKERDFSLGFNGGSSGLTRATSATAADRQFPPSSSTSGGGGGGGGGGGWDNRALPNYPYHSAFQAPTDLPISGHTAIGITGSAGEEEAARQAALFTTAAGSLGSHRLIVGSSMGHHVGVSSSSRDLMTRGEDFVGLYGGVGRLGASLRRGEGQLGAATQATSVTASRSGGASIVAFVGGEFRVHGMGRGEEEAAAVAARGGVSHYDGTSLPLITAGASTAARRGEEGEAVGDVEASWPGVASVGIHGRGSGRAEQEIAKEAIHGTSVKGSADRMAAVHQLALARLEAGTTTTTSASQGGGPAEHGLQLDQLQRELMPRQRSGGVAGTGSIACQDCGNQAKKDCAHMRCRTCCKTRGFDCPTHVKSTWVPASRRRERQQTELVGGLQQDPYNRPPKSKRARTLSLVGVGGDPAADGAAPSHTSTSTGTPPRSSDINSAAALPPEGKFRVLPPEVRTQAVFRCVRLTGLIDGQDEYAYQTVVKIGGHIFKGILYDQGPDKIGFTPANVAAELQLGGRSAPSSSALIDLEGIYGSGGSAILGALR